MPKAKKILLNILAALIAFILIFAAAGFIFIRFYVMPKYNENAQLENRSELTGSDIADFAKYFTNKQLIANLKNFDRSAAKDVLEAMTEIADENPPQQENPSDWDSKLTELLRRASENGKNVLSSKRTQITQSVPPSETTQIAQNVPSSQQSAYDRIMAAADKDEISAGLAIISKIDVSTINSLQSQGKTEELKAYIREHLSSSEISVSLALYNKYKHLL